MVALLDLPLDVLILILRGAGEFHSAVVKEYTYSCMGTFVNAVEAMRLLVRHPDAAFAIVAELLAIVPRLYALIVMNMEKQRLVVHDADVQRALVRVQSRVLHGEHPRDLVGFVVVGVPPPRRGDEDAAFGPVAANGVDDVTLGVDLLTHQGVHVGLRRHRKVQRHRVVPVRALNVLRRVGGPSTFIHTSPQGKYSYTTCFNTSRGGGHVFDLRL